MKANVETDEAGAGTMTLSTTGGTDWVSGLQARSVFVVATGDEEFVQAARDLHENAPSRSSWSSTTARPTGKD